MAINNDIAIITIATISNPSAKVKRFQTPLDFTAEFAGSLEALFTIAQLNDFGITDDLIPGTELQTILTDEDVIDFYANSNDLNIITQQTSDAPLPSGIGFMQIGGNFKVS